MKKFLAGSSLFLLPVLAFAQGATTAAVNAFDLVKILQNIIDVALPFIIGLAVLVFLWGLFQFISSAGDEEARANAKQLIIWSVIGIFVMVSVWGLVNIFVKTFNLSTTPEFPSSTFVVPTPEN